MTRLLEVLRPCQWAVLVLVTLAALGLRSYELPRIFLWLDDTEFFNTGIFGSPPQPLIEYALDRKNATTNTLGWPAAVWMSAALFGRTPGGARVASVVAGTLAVPSIFFLMLFLLRRGGVTNAFAPSVAAAVLATIVITHMELSQRLYAYGATPLFSALIFLAHFNALDELDRQPRSVARLGTAMLFYALAGGFSLFVNPSLALAVFISAVAMGWAFLRAWRRGPEDQRAVLISLGGLAALTFFFSGLLNAKNPAYGFRYYMRPYYHGLDAGAPWFLLKQTYDLLTYHLNLFYRSDFYWPQRANPILLPLVALCLLGWWAAASGRFGGVMRRAAHFGFAALSVPAVLSILRVYTYGGERRSLYLAPLILGFTALGFTTLISGRRTRLLGIAAGAVYLLLWAVNLPLFYTQRVTPYSAADIVALWRENGKPPLFVAAGGGNAIRYMVREHNEIQMVASTDGIPTPPYLLVSLHWPIEKDAWDPKHAEKLRQKGYKVTLLAERPAPYLESWDYPTCLYFPPNGFWVYKITQ